MANTPQQPFFSQQTVVSPNLDDYYVKVIKSIDSFRSTFDATTSNIRQTISQSSLDNVFAQNETNSRTPQESRCNAFFRMMGFPVVSADGSNFYSPGFDPDLNRDQDQLQKHIDIANSLLGGLEPILNAREIYAKNSSNLFRAKDDNAAANAIASIYVRPFDKQFKEGLTPLASDDQQFEVPDRNFVSVDFASEVNITTKSTHILKPFVVDPRIDFTVTPSANRICAPFLTDKSKTQITKGRYLKRPYIEKIISVRFNKTDVVNTPAGKTEINQYVNDLISFIKNSPDIKNSSLINVLANPLQSLHTSEIAVFSKFINVINAFVQQLAENITEINKIRTRINWKPIPDIGGPELGSTLNEVDQTDTTNNKRIEVDIANTEFNRILSQTDFNIGIDEADLGNFAFSDIDDIVFSSTQHNYDFYDQQYNTLTRQRNELGNRANSLLQQIEYITGEFSGLGLLDIIAIQATLWIISPGALLGLIDDVAISRMQTNASLKADTSARLSITDALTEFETKLSGVYVLFNSFFQNVFDFNGKNNK